MVGYSNHLTRLPMQRLVSGKWVCLIVGGDVLVPKWSLASNDLRSCPRRVFG